VDNDDVVFSVVPSQAGTIATKDNHLTVSTNSPVGYSISFRSTNDGTSGGDNACMRGLTQYNAKTTCTSYDHSTAPKFDQCLTCGSAGCVSDTLPATKWSVSADSGSHWVQVPSAGQSYAQIKNRTTAATNDATTITYGVNATLNQKPGTVRASLDFNVIANLPGEPTITAIYNTDTDPDSTPASGPTAGGTHIAINGSDLDTAYQVFIDLNSNGDQDVGETCTSPNIVSASQITCTTPAGTAGTYDVVVKTWGGETKGTTNPPANTTATADDYAYGEPPTYMQDFTTTMCDELDIYRGAVVGGAAEKDKLAVLTDIRNDQEYYVGKLADGNCWMLNNLKLGSTNEPTPLTPADTNIVRDWNLPQVGVDNSSSNTYYDEPRAYGPVPDPIGDPSSDNIDDETFYGYLYNWCATTAGGNMSTSGGTNSNTCTEENDRPADATTGDICPANWRLPKGGHLGDIDNEFDQLSAKMAGYPDNQGGYKSDFNSGAPLFYEKFMFTGPFRGVSSGYWDMSFVDLGYVGFWWSGSASPDYSLNAHDLYMWGGVIPSNASMRDFGSAVRCLLQPTTPSGWVKADSATSNTDASARGYAISIDANMIPIIRRDDYDTDSAPSNRKWADYTNKRWANAVTIRPDKLDEYKDAPIGTEIMEQHILGYWVYIPNYIYKLCRPNASDPLTLPAGACQDGNGNDIVSVAAPYLFDIRFKKGYSVVSMIPDPVPAGHQLDHPAFPYSADGLWVGKFESSNPTSPRATTANDIYIKPNQLGVSGSNISQQFQMSLDIGKNGVNTHNLNSLGSHMLKNSEWGAIAYLATSIYGRGTSELYVNSCDDNTYNSSLSGNTVNDHTGWAGLGPSVTAQSNCSAYTVDYNDSPQAYDGAIGVHASTTDNVYGVYDMSGGNYDHVMGNYGDTVGSSGFASMPAAGYYNSYPSSIFTSGARDNNNLCTWDTCGGHALHETKTQDPVTSNTGSWNADVSDFVYSSNPWFRRGGFSNWSSGVGLFYHYYSNGGASDYDGFRVSIYAESPYVPQPW
jgi:hypothetical protein